jgi:chemotaxis protein methyltransferase CheR
MRPLFDPVLVRAMRSQVLPLLRTYPSVAVWHAGCGDGEALWATAILVHEAGLWPRTRIWATDVDPATLERARSGSYDRGCLSADGTSDDDPTGGVKSLAEYVRIEAGRVTLRPTLRDRIAFFQHDLTTDASFREFQLIVCQGLLPTLPARQASRARAVLDDSLVRLGLLVLGPGETPRRATGGAGYVPLDAGARLFRRATS